MEGRLEVATMTASAGRFLECARGSTISLAFSDNFNASSCGKQRSTSSWQAKGCGAVVCNSLQLRSCTTLQPDGAGCERW